MTLKTKGVRLSPREDDSRSIDHGSRHVHIDPGWILGKAVKNAHDAYLAVEPEQLDREKLERAVVISRQRHTNGTGRLFIEDNGVGRLFTNLRRDVRPGMRGMNREPYRVKNAASLHDICSWALGAGSKVAIESTIRGVAMRSRLEINVRCIHEKMRVDSLERVLTDPECISVSVDECDPTDHGTMLEIECDGKPESINGSELNLLYDMTDPEDKTFKCALADRCPIPYATEEGIGKRIREFYDSAGYVPVAMYVDGERLERLVPDNLTALHTSAIRFRGKITAVAWYVEHPRSPSGIHVEVAKHLISGPGFRLVKNNVPIGPRNIFGDSTLSKPLKEFIGEVHIISPDVEPDASGQDLRIGPTRDFFIEALREFYDFLSRRADAKSRQLKSEKNVWQHAGAARGLGR